MILISGSIRYINIMKNKISFDKIGSVETRNSENENYSDYDIGTKITIEYKNLTPDNYE